MLRILPISPQRFYCLDNILRSSHHVTAYNRAVISSLLGPNIQPELPPPPKKNQQSKSYVFFLSVRMFQAHKKQTVTALQPNLSFGILDRRRADKRI